MYTCLASTCVLNLLATYLNYTNTNYNLCKLLLYLILFQQGHIYSKKTRLMHYLELQMVEEDIGQELLEVDNEEIVIEEDYGEVEGDGVLENDAEFEVE